MLSSQQFMRVKAALQTGVDEALPVDVDSSRLLEERDSSHRSLIFYCKREAAVSALLEAKASLETRDKYGATPLLVLAYTMEEPDFCKLVANHRVRESALLQTDSFCNSLLHIVHSTLVLGAIERRIGKQDWRELLLRVNEDGNTCAHLAAARAGESGAASLRFLLSRSPALAEALNAKGRAPLHVAAESGRNGCIRALTAARASVNGRDACGWTPLHFAVMGAWPLHESHVSTASLLLELKADVNAPECTQHWAPVHVATDAVAVELLMDNGADVRSRDSAGQSVMHMCAPEVARALLDKLPREQWMPLVEARDAQDRVPLHVASSPAKVSVLASACPSSINAVDKSGRTPLDLALSSDRHDVAQELACAYGAVRGKKVKTKERSASHTMLYITSGVMLVVAVGILVGRYAPRGGNYIR